MSIDALLVAPSVHGGGEGVYAQTLAQGPPPDVSYRVTGPFHHGATGVSCDVVREVLLNRVVHPLVVPNLGFRALRIRTPLDLVHVHAHAVRLARLGSTPVVMSEGSSPAVYLGDYAGWPDARIARGFDRTRRIYRTLGIHDALLGHERAARVYVFSEWARQVNLRWGADPGKLTVVYPGFPDPDPQPGVHERSEAFQFLFVGTAFERKGGFDLIEAFDALVAEGLAVHLTVVSPPPAAPNPDHFERSWVAPGRRARVLERFEALRRGGQLRWLGLTDRAALFAEHFPAADAVVLPALAEGFGFTNVEAMSFGLPVISTTVGPIPEIVADGVSGLLSAPEDVEGLSAAMRTLAGDRDTARRMGQAGRADFLQRFTFDRFRAALGRCYSEALSR